jgi:hypothetical protein
MPDQESSLIENLDVTELSTHAQTTWNNVADAAQLLIDHIQTVPTEKVQLRTILTNQVLALLVTGFETYCENRFIELLLTASVIDFGRMDQKIVPKEKQIDMIPVEEEKIVDVPSARRIIRRYRINFQDYENSKRAYNSAFGIRFGELGLSNQLLEQIQRYLLYRHRIIHVSPMLEVLNAPDVPPASPVMANLDMAREALATFKLFIGALHCASNTIG